MKRITSFILVICVVLSSAVMLASCEKKKEHNYKTEWSSDATNHWHECADEGCTEVADKAEHNWNGDVCTVCNATKKAEEKPQGISKEKWEEITSAIAFENYTLVQTGLVTPQGQSAVQQDCLIKFANDKVALQISLGEGDPLEMIYEGIEAEEQKASYESVFMALLDNFDDFKYDATDKTYKNPEAITVEITMASQGMTASITMANGVVTLDSNGKIATFECDYTQTTTVMGQAITAVADMHWTFSNYGTTVIE